MIRKFGVVAVLVLLLGCTACKQIETTISLEALEKIMSIRHTGLSEEVIQEIQYSCTDKMAETIIADVQEKYKEQWKGNTNYKLAVQSYELYDDMTMRVVLESSQKDNVLNNRQVIEMEVNKDGKIKEISTDDITCSLLYD